MQPPPAPRRPPWPVPPLLECLQVADEPAQPRGRHYLFKDNTGERTSSMHSNQMGGLLALQSGSDGATGGLSIHARREPTAPQAVPDGACRRTSVSEPASDEEMPTQAHRVTTCPSSRPGAQAQPINLAEQQPFSASGWAADSGGAFVP